MGQVRLWNHEAKRALVTTTPAWLSYYVGGSYRKATEIALRYVTADASKISLLKTDLWNEAIETRRDILGQYERNEKFQLYGVDLSPIVCHRAQTRLSKTHVVQGGITDLPFRDESFDIVLDLSVLDHVPASQVPAVIAEYARLEKRGSIVLLIYWYRSGMWKLTNALLRYKRGSNTIPREVTQYYHDRNLVSDEMRKHYDIIKEFNILTLLVLPTDILQKKLPIRFYGFVTEFEYSRVSRCLLRDFGALHAIVGRKR